MPTEIRPHYPSGTPLIAVDNAAAALEFYRAAFDAELLIRLDGPDGRIMHSAIRVYGAPIVVVDEMPEVALLSPGHYGGAPFSITLSCPDADAAYAKAVAAGAASRFPVRADFSGGRHGLVVCPFGHRWLLTTRTEDLTVTEIEDRFRAAISGGFRAN
ncbi:MULTISPECIES: VOC family protein [unclassified Nocardia]|uniref:VOC family protein n=1 Tax=unclassified Nocardia TaxID=2637762 RepID=UPI001CE40412|nr:MULTISPECIES: VOC family protein [unclassified Nocardia]